MAMNKRILVEVAYARVDQQKIIALQSGNG